MGYGFHTEHHPTPGATSRETGKRVKSILTTDQVIHVWAQRTQSYGQNAKRSVFFEGDKLFSYGYHWLMAQFVTNARGELAALINSERYTQGTTTNNHTNSARHAVRDDVPRFAVAGAGGDLDWNGDGAPPVLPERKVKAALDDYVAKAVEAFGKAKRARSQWSINYQTRRAVETMEEAQAFADWSGYAWERPDLGAALASAQEAVKRARAREAQALADAKAKAADDFAAWQAGAARRCPAAFATDEKGSVYLRKAGDLLETSRGASVPWDHAVKAFRFIKLCKAKGEAFQRNGRTVRVGHFTVDRIAPNGDMHAGCHFFSWTRIEEVARREGVLDLAPDAGAVVTSHH